MDADRDALPVPDVVLERYRLGELAPRERRRLERRIEHDVALRSRLIALEASDADIRARQRADRFSETIRRRVAERGSSAADTRTIGAISRPRRLRAAWLAPIAVVVLVSAVIVTVTRSSDQTVSVRDRSSASGGDRIKGLLPALAVYRRTPEGSETLADGAVARAGDVIRVGYRPAGKRFGVIVSSDGRGAVTVHLPRQGDTAAPLKSEAMVLLDEAYELDDAPRWEQFYFVTAEDTFDVAPIVAAARRAAAGPGTPATLALSPNLEQATFSLRKEATP